MHLEIFSEGASPVHKINENVKLLVFIPFAIYISLCSNAAVLVIFLALAAGLCLYSRLDIKKLMERVVVLNLFLLFFWLILPFSFPGTAIFRLGRLTATAEGADFAYKISLKANAIVLLTVALIGTIPVLKLASALKFIGVPDKLAAVLYFCNKHITVLHSDYTRIRNAMKTRGFRFKTSLRTYRVMGNALGILLLRSHVYSQKLYESMLCRGFNGKFPMVSEKGFRRRDLIFAASAALIFIIILWINQ